MRLVLYLILVAALVNAIAIDKALSVLPPKELKRRARTGHDKKAAAIYRLSAYGHSMTVLLWLKGSVAAALLFILLISNWAVAIVYIAILIWLVRGWHIKNTKNLAWTWVALVAPLVAWSMSKFQPVMKLFLRGNHQKLPLHTKVYEKEDLLDLLQAQLGQPDNRIPDDELKMAANALTFGDKKVSDVMTPLRKMRVVGESEQVGPLLMDELHGTGFSRFPVVSGGSSSAQPNFIGTLFLKDIILKESGQVRDVMHKKIFFINEQQSLRDGLNAFLKNHYHLFVVVNNFEEVVGVVSIEDVLEQILGKLIVDEFDQYDDLRAVAGLEAKRESAQRDKVPVAPEPK
jgi:CBS domain containing-hemolysin-like protein